MNKNKLKAERRIKRHKRVRGNLVGTPSRPRLAIYKSLKHMHAQIIDDLAGKTIVAASSVESAANIEGGKTGNGTAAAAVGKLIADRAKKAGISEVAFDRGGFKFHGRVKALAEAARKEGLKF
ncbi:MAG: 50S ribosomal protein L18 [Phycisphaerales bacterium]|nr:50S ribosomal protein L18 [Phycisphaerales bacterium]